MSIGTLLSLLEEATADLILPGEKFIFIAKKAVFNHPAMTDLEADDTFPLDVMNKD
ncbi:hypothetical protein JYU34_022749 [Plutella xylostella]|uniref:Uncharacterized protein n=1 Tax=Plutella xylostella TaxID=51655 RepID=A0ABQ7PPF6_PLUXY|nr:hypothetical protein JYU34_022749 [Plutella xylostella]